MEPFTIFSTDTEGVVVVAGTAGTVEGFIVRIYMGILGNKVDETSIISKVGPIDGSAVMVVIRRAAVEGRRPVGLAVGSTNGQLLPTFVSQPT